jgi:hypothetical protein
MTAPITNEWIGRWSDRNPSNIMHASAVKMSGARCNMVIMAMNVMIMMHKPNIRLLSNIRLGSLTQEKPMIAAKGTRGEFARYSNPSFVFKKDNCGMRGAQYLNENIPPAMARTVDK